MSKVFSLVTSLLVSARAVLTALWRKGFDQSVLGLRICSVCGCYDSQASWRGFIVGHLAFERFLGLGWLL